MEDRPSSGTILYGDDDTGGYAFPIYDLPLSDGGLFSSPGMTLMDWFAGQALGGNFDAEGTDEMANLMGIPTAEWIAIRSYKIAEAMLAEREKRLAAAQKEELKP